MHVNPRSSRLRSGVRNLLAVGVLAVLAVDVAAPVAASELEPARLAHPAAATTVPGAVDALDAFTARVRSVTHRTGEIEVVGTGRAGELIRVVSDTIAETGSGRVEADGSFRVVVRATRATNHALVVHPSVPSKPIELSATTEYRVDPFWSGEPDAANRALDLGSRSGWHAGARILVNVDGFDVAEVTADRDGRWAYRLEGLAFGTHRVFVSEVFDGATQFRDGDDFLIDGSPSVSSTAVDLRASLLSASGTAPAGTRVVFTDRSGQPIPTAAGEAGVPVDDGRWTATFALPSEEVRLHTIVARTMHGTSEVGSDRAGFVIPIRFTAQVQRFGPKRLVLTGGGEPGASVVFLDADGSPIRDVDGAAVTVAVAPDGLWQRTLDPRRFVGGTVHAVASGDGGGFLGEQTVTFR